LGGGACAIFAAVIRFAIAAVVCGTVLYADHGLPVGSKMPPFTAPDQNGAARSLRDILGKNGAAILFFRSADW
jgi:hypothetical protein